MFAISAFLGRDLINSALNSLGTNLSQKDNAKVKTSFAVISDTHSDSSDTQRALQQIKSLGLKFVIHSGDWTTVGTIDELKAQKAIFDRSGLTYWGVMGDHDRWQSGSANFEKVLGRPYESFDRDNLHFILLDDSDLTNGLGEEQLDWLSLDLKKNPDRDKIIVMHLPPYHPSSDRTLAGKGGTNNSGLQEQTDQLLNMIKDQKVLAIFSGDHHLSQSYTEPKTSVKIFISGAATSERNLQTPRWELVQVLQDQTVRVTDQVIN
ncbi:MAG TPA: metallophosphoesterase [Candidatus Saccharimonadales bacterium]|nr:metallophosphoesterase [Candidatus Saccharimonadales bacterium]